MIPFTLTEDFSDHIFFLCQKCFFFVGQILLAACVMGVVSPEDKEAIQAHTLLPVCGLNEDPWGQGTDRLEGA